jgi:hypothetical protein
VQPAVLLWDFGDTLADERWMRRLPSTCPSWAEVWQEVMASQADGWNDGTIGAAEIFAAVADRSGMTIADVEAHARDCCGQLEFNVTALRVATERRVPQALVTVNPDIFGQWIVPRYDLTTTFDTIVISSAERTNDKNELCDIALDRLGIDRGDRSHALLIDNRVDLVEAWQVAGGAGYWFRGDERFGRDLHALLQ